MYVRFVAYRISHRNVCARHDRTLRVGDSSFYATAGAVRHYKRERDECEREDEDDGFELS